MSGAAPDPIDDPLVEGLWEARDVAAFLRISPRSVYDLPGMPFVKLRIKGDRWLKRYVPAEVRAWTRARLTHSVLDQQPPQLANGEPIDPKRPRRA